MTSNSFGYQGRLTSEVLKALGQRWPTELTGMKDYRRPLNLSGEEFERVFVREPIGKLNLSRRRMANGKEGDPDTVFALQEYYRVLEGAGYAEKGKILSDRLLHDLKIAGFMTPEGGLLQSTRNDFLSGCGHAGPMGYVDAFDRDGLCTPKSIVEEVTQKIEGRQR